MGSDEITRLAFSEVTPMGTAEEKGRTPAPEKTKGAKPAGGDNGESPAANIDQIRDIIFGTQMREYDRRFDQLEERLLKESAELRDDLKNRFASLEQFVKKEADSLSTGLKAEQQGRAAAIKELAGSQAEQGRGQERKLSELEEQTFKTHRELRAQLLDQSKALQEEIQKKTADLTAALKRESADLRTGKIDRTALAAMFTEMAARLAAESKRGANA